MSITRKDVEHIANLAKLNLTENEIEEFTGDLNQILEYVDKLNELNTENVNPLSHPVVKNNVFREDTVKQSVDRTEALKNAPKADDEFFKVPKVISSE
jgi:aspartyl-tRNA(Asn)/glutamyl-tRNA(Gln) amidotransferase subunit C